MFEYFPNNYTWSLGVMGAINRGGQISEIDEACRPLKEYAGIKALGGDPTAQRLWFESWMKLAERVERLGRADEEAKHPLSAGRKYLRAGSTTCGRERMPSHKDPRRLDAYSAASRSTAAGSSCGRAGGIRRGAVRPARAAGPLLEGAGARARAVRGALRRPRCHEGADHPSVADEFRRRGISLLIVDHPGWARHCGCSIYPADRIRRSPRGRRGLPADARRCRPRAHRRDGASLGGYYAPRAAAFEKRFKCCVAWGAIFDYGKCVADRLGGRGEPSVPGYAENVNWVFGKESIEETLKVVNQMTLEGVADKITCPLLVIHGENDRQVPLWHAERTIEAAVNSPQRELKICRLADGAAEHCGADNGPLIVDYMTDWVADRLAR
jgi:pimeloyl-ACP methyl ester carboxylesterase